MKHVKCSLCDSPNEEFLYYVHDRNSPAKERFRLVRCVMCGLVFLNPRPVESEISGYYPPWYHSRYMDNQWLESLTIQGIPWRDAMRGKGANILKYKSSGRILDVGCGDGILLKFFQEQGFDVYGVESGDVSYAVKILGLNIHNGRLEDANYQDGFFDVISFYHVFEHLHDPFKTLLLVHSLLNNNGIVVIEVPNFAGFEARIFRSSWVGISAPLHLYHFTLKTLAELLTKAGFEILDKGSVPEKSRYIAGYSESLRFFLADKGLYAHPWEQRKVDRNAKDEKQNLEKSVFSVKAALHRLEYLFFSVPAFLVHKLGMGSSIYCVARRR